MRLVSLNEATGKRIVFLEFVISSRLIVAEDTGDGQVLGSSIEDNSCWLTLGRSHMNGTKINGIVPTVKCHLKLEIISIVLGCIGDFADELRNMGMSLSTLLSLLFSLNQVTVF